MKQIFKYNVCLCSFYRLSTQNYLFNSEYEIYNLTVYNIVYILYLTPTLDTYKKYMYIIDHYISFIWFFIDHVVIVNIQKSSGFSGIIILIFDQKIILIFK